MKQFNYTPDELNMVVYQVQGREKEHEKVKLEMEKLEDKRKIMFAEIKSRIISSTGCSNAQAETDTLTSKEWEAFLEKYYVEREKFIDPKCDFNHSMRVMDGIVEGMRYNSKLLMKNVHDVGGK